jgi:hypothetical protein
MEHGAALHLPCTTPTRGAAAPAAGGAAAAGMHPSALVLASPLLKPGHLPLLLRCRLIPTTWVIYGMSASQLGDNNGAMVAYGGQNTTVSAYLQDNFGYYYDFRCGAHTPGGGHRCQRAVRLLRRGQVGWCC